MTSRDDRSSHPATLYRELAKVAPTNETTVPAT
jgi:hypothetical protein